jgi:hypothetical protein
MVSVPSNGRIGVKKSSLNKKEIQKILSGVPKNQVFYFYKGIGQPLEQTAASLTDLFKKIEKVELQSISFHQARGDFENWIRDVLGNGEVALRINRIQSKLGEPVRAEIFT